MKLVVCSLRFFSAVAEIFYFKPYFMLTKQQKKTIVQNLTDELSRAKSVVFSDFKGLKTKDSQELRAALRKEGVSHQVVKITLLKRVLGQSGADVSSFKFQVPLAVSMSFDDEVAPARVLNLFAKTHESLKILAGIFDGKMVDAAGVKVFASLPGKQELYGQLVSVIAGPLRGLVTVLSGNIRGLINVLNAKVQVQNAK